MNGVDDSATTVPVPAYSIVRPTLNIVPNGSQIVVSWHGGGFQLKQSGQLSPASFGPVNPVSSVVQGLLNTVTLTRPAGTMFYRLELQ